MTSHVYAESSNENGNILAIIIIIIISCRQHGYPWPSLATSPYRSSLWEKSVSWVLSRKKKVDFRLLAVALWWVRTWFGADGKVSIERWYLSPYVEKPLNSKVIKSFVPELRSRKFFLCFGIRMLYVWVMNTLCTFRISVSWLCYTGISLKMNVIARLDFGLVYYDHVV